MGTAGALRACLDTADVVVRDRAVRDEGVSHHYLPSARWAEPSTGLTDTLRRSLTDAGLGPSTGSAWTIDAPFRETVAEARHYAEEGVAVVEMEAAALFSVARSAGSRSRRRSPSATRWPTASGCRSSAAPASPPA
jgi:uridine phosphorylase